VVSVLFLLIGAIIVATTWGENRGRGQGGGGGGLADGMRAMMRSPALLALAALQVRAPAPHRAGLVTVPPPALLHACAAAPSTPATASHVLWR
jgi:hypothetical protein